MWWETVLCCWTGVTETRSPNFVLVVRLIYLAVSVDLKRRRIQDKKGRWTIKPYDKKAGDGKACFFDALGHEGLIENVECLLEL